MTDLDPTITPEFPPKSAFRKWLRSLPADEVVADKNWDCCTCPLAVWLTATRAATWAYVDPSERGPGVWEVDNIPRSPLPAWANAFGSGIDRLGQKIDAPARPVTAADCLRVLARTPRA